MREIVVLYQSEKKSTLIFSKLKMRTTSHYDVILHHLPADIYSYCFEFEELPFGLDHSSIFQDRQL